MPMKLCSSLEMLVSHSPPVFSHSPPSSFYSEYSSCRTSDRRSKHTGLRRSTSAPHTFFSIANSSPAKMPASPKRPCLVIRPEETLFNGHDPTSPTRLKKKVMFADDKGMALAHVRIMTEPSNVPPLWSHEFLAEVTQGVSAEPEAVDEPWEVAFPQPASDYLDFRKKLEANKVSLENVMVKGTSEKTINGTVKVSNISFEKEVIIRLTYDDWKTSKDVTCDYAPIPVSSSSVPAYVRFDTFCFDIPLRREANKVDFCVCFRCEGAEHWDNNNEKNYTIVKRGHRDAVNKGFFGDDASKDQSQLVPSATPTAKYSDIAHAKFSAWSEFASWTHLETSGPYW